MLASNFRTVRRPLAAALALAIVAAATIPSAYAQRFKSIPAKMDDRTARGMRSQVASVLRDPAAYQSNGKSVVDSYFKTYYFPIMTRTSSADLAELGDNRETLIKYLRGTTVPAAQAYLTNMTLDAMRVLCRDSYHPAVRYNAALVLGLLDQRYPGNQPPIVLPEATNDLLELLEQNEFNGVKVHPSVKVAALQGLQRHLRYGIDQQYAARVTAAALAMLTQEPGVLQVRAEVNNWIKCEAAQVLALQAKDGPTKEVQQALTALISDEKMSLEDRCRVVGMLSKVQYANAADADLAATVMPLGSLAKEVLAEGAEKATEFEDLRVGNNPSSFRPSRSRNSRRDDDGPKLERRKLLSFLTSIEQGATSLSNGLADEEKQKLQSLTALLMPVMELSGDTKKIDLEVTSAVRKLRNDVDNLVASWQPAEVAPAAAADAEEAFSE